MIDYNIYSVPNYSKVMKNTIISLLKQSTRNSINDNNQKIYWTDWNPSCEIEEQPYHKYIKSKIINDFVKYFCKIFNRPNKIRIPNLWFQIYKKDDFHEYHVHSDTHFTNIFYVDLPNKEVKTDILDLKGSKVNLNVREGDILTIPAYLLHRSPVNKFNEEKIIISFNSSFYD